MLFSVIISVAILVICFIIDNTVSSVIWIFHQDFHKKLLNT